MEDLTRCVPSSTRAEECVVLHQRQDIIAGFSADFSGF